MPSLTFGIFTYTGGTWTDEVQVTPTIEIVKRRGSDGTFVKGKALNPTNDFSIKGGGGTVSAVGLATLTLVGISGGVKYIEKAPHTDKNNDFDDFECSGTHLPGGTDAG